MAPWPASLQFSLSLLHNESYTVTYKGRKKHDDESGNLINSSSPSHTLSILYLLSSSVCGPHSFLLSLISGTHFLFKTKDFSCFLSFHLPTTPSIQSHVFLSFKLPKKSEPLKYCTHHFSLSIISSWSSSIAHACVKVFCKSNFQFNLFFLQPAKEWTPEKEISCQ